MRILRCTSLRQWRDELLPLLGVGAVDFEPLNDAPFMMSANLPVGLPGILECQFSAGIRVRSRELIKGGSDTFYLLIQKTDGCHCKQIDKHIQLDRGEATLTRGDEPSRTGAPANFRTIIIAMPKAEFDARGIRPDDAVMQRLSSSNEALGLLQRCLRSLGKSGIDRTVEFGAPTAARVTVQRHIFDLVALALSWRGTVGESDLGSVAAARLQAALDYIAAHFNNPRLSFEMVARSQGISESHLRKLMKASGHSYVDVVNELRLQKAFNELTADEPGGHTILQIALAAGFSDISHFNRLFRIRFGDTPSGVRGQNRPPRAASSQCAAVCRHQR